MITGLGVDIVHIPTFKKALLETPRLKRRVFSEAEQKNTFQSLAARFAVKEAFIKSLRGELQIELRDIVVCKQDKSPSLNIDYEKYPYLKNFEFELSISHNHDYAIAAVLSNRKLEL